MVLAAAAIAYLVILLALMFAYLEFPALATALPTAFGPVPLPVPWWGALGGVIGSLYGVYIHNQDWDPSYDLWQYTRPIVGAVMGSVAVHIYQLLVALAPGGKSAGGSAIAYYLAAFVVGNSDSLFHQLVLDPIGLVREEGRGFF